MTKRTFYLRCLECFQKKVRLTVDTLVDTAEYVGNKKCKCSNCKTEWKLDQLGDDRR